MEDVMSTIREELGIKNSKRESPKTKEVNKKKRIDLEFTLISEDKEILNPFRYLISNPGVNLHHDFILGLNCWLGAPKEIVSLTSELTCLLICGILLIDDMQDNGSLRRNSPSAYLIYKIPKTINAIDFIFSYCTEALVKLGNSKANHLAISFVKSFFRGQAKEMYWRDNFICPTEEEYKQMVLKKTGCYTAFMYKLLNLYGKVQIDALRLLVAFTLHFQINDDYQNLSNQHYYDKKGFCEDISEGKFSFPIIYVVNNFPEEGKQIIDILRQRTKDVEIKKQCRDLIEKCGGFEYTRKVLRHYGNIMLEEARIFGSDNSFFNEKVLRRLEDTETDVFA